jgi:hypothetical protein
MNKYINTRDWSALQKDFLSAKPFNHVVIDNIISEVSFFLLVFVIIYHTVLLQLTVMVYDIEV